MEKRKQVKERMMQKEETGKEWYLEEYLKRETQMTRSNQKNKRNYIKGMLKVSEGTGIIFYHSKLVRQRTKKYEANNWQTG